MFLFYILYIIQYMHVKDNLQKVKDNLQIKNKKDKILTSK